MRVQIQTANYHLPPHLEPSQKNQKQIRNQCPLDPWIELHPWRLNYQHDLQPTATHNELIDELTLLTNKLYSLRRIIKSHAYCG